MRLARQGSPSQRAPLYPSLSSSRLSIVNALKETNSRKRFNSDLTTIVFDNIEVHNVKYLPPSYDGNLLFVLVFELG